MEKRWLVKNDLISEIKRQEMIRVRENKRAEKKEVVKSGKDIF